MKTMKKIKCLSGVIVALALFFTSCSDKDHYSVANMGGDATLWENISSDEELSNFASVLEATGYANKLSTSQVFTVFAPNNDKLSKAECDNLIAEYNKEKSSGVKDDKNTVIVEFIQNHIALYNYTVSEASDPQSIRMMNGKGSWFTSSSLAGVNFQKKNLLASNGVLYVLSDKINYSQNIYEYIKRDTGGDEGLDSLSNFLYKYHFTEFQAKESTPGEIVDGKLQYLDSVTTVRNEILDEWLKAKLDSEDSSYYAVLPTNKAWKEQYDVNKYFFKYVHNSQSPDTVVSSELRDSFEYVLPRYLIIAGAQFSRTTNPKLGIEKVDSVVSPLAVKYGYRKLNYGSFDKRVYEYLSPYEVKPEIPSSGIFVEPDSILCSNGVAFKANEWKIQRGNTFLQDIGMEAETSTTLDSVYYVVPSGATPLKIKPSWISRDVKSSSPFYEEVMGHKYCKLQSNTSAMAGALFNFTNVLSNLWYDLYVVTVPSTASDHDPGDNLPTRIQATIYCKTPEGLQDSIEFKTAYDPSKTYGRGTITIEDFGDITIDTDYTRTPPYSYETDPTTVHKVRIGRIKFPTCTYWLPDPMVKFRVEVNVLSTSVGVTKSRNLYIDRVLLSPVIDKSINDIKNNL